MGHGGRRPGAGRKPFKHTALVVAAESSGIKPQKAPAPLPADVDKVWEALAPLAADEATLTPSTEHAFRELCRWIVQMELGWAAQSAGKDVNMSLMLALAKLVEGGMRSFRLAPFGKPHDAGKPKAKTQSALDRLKEQRQGLHAVK